MTSLHRLLCIMACALLFSLTADFGAAWPAYAQLPSADNDASAMASDQIIPAPPSANLDDIFTAFAKYTGEFRTQDDQAWGNPSPERVASQAKMANVLQQKITSFRANNTLNLDAETSLSIIEHILDRDVRDFAFDTARIPFTGDYGFHMMPILAAYSTRIANIEDANAWIDRLDKIPTFFDLHQANAQRGLDTGFVAHIDPVRATIEQIRAQAGQDAENSDLFLPFISMPDTINGKDRVRIFNAARKSVRAAVKSYDKLLKFFEEDYAPKARVQTGLSSLENGRDLYAAFVGHHTTTPNLTPEMIHTIGQSEVKRIRHNMTQILFEVNFDGDLKAFIAMLRTDRQFYAQSEAELMGHAALLSKRLDALLPKYFATLPRLTYGVIPVPASYASTYTTGRYQSGNPLTGEAGNFLVNTHRLDQRPLYELPALSAHEAVPGHHLQISLAQEIGEDFPEFRQNYYANAFGEGWALYAEKLVGEAGFYQTPYERFGQLSYEMWRACRLVVDTGIHLYNWTREQARRCFIENTALAPHNIKTEITRYIGWPGQAVSYKIGELKILELREYAKKQLGEGFDLRQFHNVILAQGSVPLPSLERQVYDWVSAQLAVTKLVALNAAAPDTAAGAAAPEDGDKK